MDAALREYLKYDARKGDCTTLFWKGGLYSLPSGLFYTIVLLAPSVLCTTTCRDSDAVRWVRCDFVSTHIKYFTGRASGVECGAVWYGMGWDGMVWCGLPYFVFLVFWRRLHSPARCY